MPTIAWFYGIAIRMKDHPPPHFHAIYGEHEAFVAITSGEVLDGFLPKGAARLVKEWTLLRQTQLTENWRRAGAAEPLERIPGLDADESGLFRADWGLWPSFAIQRWFVRHA